MTCVRWQIQSACLPPLKSGACGAGRFVDTAVGNGHSHKLSTLVRPRQIGGPREHRRNRSPNCYSAKLARVGVGRSRGISEDDNRRSESGHEETMDPLV